MTADEQAIFIVELPAAVLHEIEDAAGFLETTTGELITDAWYRSPWCPSEKRI